MYTHIAHMMDAKVDKVDLLFFLLMLYTRKQQKYYRPFKFDIPKQNFVNLKFFTNNHYNTIELKYIHLIDKINKDILF